MFGESGWTRLGRLGLASVGLWSLASAVTPDHALAADRRADPRSAPLVEPRPVVPDSVRARDRARADSLRALQPHLSGGQALAVGLAGTLAPAGISLLVNPVGSNSEFAWEASLTIGVALGVLAGPALGLSSGGRPDLARRGLIIRGVGYTAALMGLFVVASSFESDVGGGGMAVIAAGAVGAGVSAVSCIHDLAITPSAVDRSRSVTLRPVVDEQGRLALRATF